MAWFDFGLLLFGKIPHIVALAMICIGRRSLVQQVNCRRQTSGEHVCRGSASLAAACVKLVPQYSTSRSQGSSDCIILLAVYSRDSDTLSLRFVDEHIQFVLTLSLTQEPMVSIALAVGKNVGCLEETET